MSKLPARADHLAIASRIAEGARVIDVGCGDGALLALLRDARAIEGRGLELSSQAAGLALARGLSVVQGDADTDLELFPDDSFDVAILSKAIQEMRQPAHVLSELGRIAPDVIVSFRNFGHWRKRIALLTGGRMPARRAWHDADALHPCTAADLIDLASARGLAVKAGAAVSAGDVGAFRTTGFGGLNWRAEEVILHLERR